MFVNNGFHIVHTTVAHFYIVFVKKTVVVVAVRKVLRDSLKNDLPMLVFTFLLKGGLYQIMFLCLLRRGLVCCLLLTYVKVSV